MKPTDESRRSEAPGRPPQVTQTPQPGHQCRPFRERVRIVKQHSNDLPQTRLRVAGQREHLDAGAVAAGELVGYVEAGAVVVGEHY